MHRDAKPLLTGRWAGVKRKKSDALIIKTEVSNYLQVLKAMRSFAKLVDLGAYPNINIINYNIEA